MKDMKDIVIFLRKPTSLLFIAVVTIVIIMLSLLTAGYFQNKSNMLTLMHQESMVLIHALEMAFQNTLLANMELEQQIVQRLFDLAMMIDRDLLTEDTLSDEMLRTLAEEHQIHRIHIVDTTGKRLVRSTDSIDQQSSVPEIFRPVYTGQQQRFIRGFHEKPFSGQTIFGVGLARSNHEGAIILSVDASYVLQFQERIGLPALLNDLVEQETSIAYIAFHDSSGSLLYSNTGSEQPLSSLPQPATEYFNDEQIYTQIVETGDVAIFEAIEPFYLNDELFGFFRIGLEMTWLNTLVYAIRNRLIAQGIIFSLLGAIAIGFLIVCRRRTALRNVFARYVSESVMENVLKQRGRITLGGERREATVLFSDIRGFTAYSEEADPEILVNQLNEYFSAMTDVIFSHEGTIDKFIGDAIMVVFGAPIEQEDHARRAVETSFDMLAALEQLNRRWEREGKVPLRIGIGINSGPMLVGHIGSERRMNYTVIGDAVNLASRVESLTKEYNTPLLITTSTYSQVRQFFEIESIGEVSIRGKKHPQQLYKVVRRI